MSNANTQAPKYSTTVDCHLCAHEPSEKDVRDQENVEFFITSIATTDFKSIREAGEYAGPNSAANSIGSEFESLIIRYKQIRESMHSLHNPDFTLLVILNHRNSFVNRWYQVRGIKFYDVRKVRIVDGGFELNGEFRSTDELRQKRRVRLAAQALLNLSKSS